MTILQFYEGLDAAKRRDALCTESEPERITPESLRRRYGGYVATHTKSKGRGKGHKTTYEWRWSDRKAYCAAMAELFPKEYGLMLCREANELLNEDRWWDTPNYRNEHLADYRREITKIRKEYGLTSDEVRRYMRIA